LLLFSLKRPPVSPTSIQEIFMTARGDIDSGHSQDDDECEGFEFIQGDGLRFYFHELIQACGGFGF